MNGGVWKAETVNSMFFLKKAGNYKINSKLFEENNESYHIKQLIFSDI